SSVVVNIMGDAYPGLKEQRDTIYRTIALEEKRFLRTMDRGLEELDSMLSELGEHGQLSGEKAFYLHSTLGLPIEVSRDIAREQGFSIDEDGFKQAVEHHAEVSKRGSLFGEIGIEASYRQLLAALEINGCTGVSQQIYGENQVYGNFEIEANLVALLRDGIPASSASVGERVEVVLD